MRIFLRIVAIATLVGSNLSGTVSAGNADRAGQAGATELLINPWARSSGWGNANSSSIRGLEAQFMNIAGMAFVQKTEVLFSNTQWLVGSGIMVNSAGIAQRIGEAGVLGIGVTTMSFGEIEKTSSELPSGGFGTFSPSLLNIGVSYAKSFSNSIHAGATVRVISESIDNLSATGIAFDVGIQYVTTLGDRKKAKNKNNLSIGMSLKNVGPPLKMSGDGLAVRGDIPTTGNSLTLEYRSAKYELPSLLNIGLAYHWRNQNLNHEFTLAGTFTSNSFSKDEIAFGAEYKFKKLFALRGGYVLRNVGGTADVATSALTGPTAGASLDFGLSKKEGATARLGVDYSYRHTNPFSGIHSIGIRFQL
jgi:hypothetical protein